MIPPLPLSLRPDTGADEQAEAEAHMRGVLRHLDMLQAQAWVLSVAREWERLGPLGFERLSVMKPPPESDAPFFHAWIKGQHLHFRPDLWEFLDHNTGAPFEDLGNHLDEFVYLLRRFPTKAFDPMGDALVSPEPFTLDQWRGRVLHLLPPDVRAAFSESEIRQQVAPIPASSLPRPRL